MIDPNDPIARDIEQALAVDHSPDLEARIRRRVSAMPAPVSRRWWYVKLAAAFAAACVVLAVMLPLRTEKQGNTLQVEQPVQDAVPIPETPPAAAGVIPEVTDGRKIVRAPETVIDQSPAQADTAEDPASEFYVSELQAPPVPVFEVAVAPLPEMIIDAVPNLEALTIEPFSLASPDSGVEE